jgi:2-polyprenyl-3-methyl-5-hydroxy-6-metoxy-1,4-benzoquinol methylase
VSTTQDLSQFTEATRCPLCNNPTFKVIYPSRYPQQITREELLQLYSSSSDHKLMDQMVECSRCSFLYLNPRIREDIILASYSNAVDPVFMQQNPMRVATFKRSLNQVLRRYHITPDKSKWVLDIGCAGGAFPKAASDAGFSVIGIEPSTWLCEAGKKAYGLDLRPGIFEKDQFPDKHFTMITLWDVLEHLTDPSGMLKAIRPILKDDGYLIVNLPDSESVMARLLGSNWPFLLSVHLSYFTPKTLEKILNQCGFRMLGVSPHFQTLELGYAVKRAAAYFKPLILVEKLLQWLGLSRLPLLYNMGQMRVVAQKQ